MAMVSADVYRPAAIEQLKTLAKQVNAEFIDSKTSEKPVDIARRAVEYARTHYQDVLIIDTAGRLAVDEEMMSEIAELHAAAQPVETLFVVDAMQGQDAVNVARAFNERLPLTGVILTKLDGDARGGAALSVRHVTGKPIKFAGVGEKLSGLEPFHPDRMAARILGMGDILSLVEEAHAKSRPRGSRKDRRQSQEGQGLRPRGLQAADRADEEDGRGGLAHRQAAGPARGTDQPRAAAGRQAVPPHRGHHQLHDAAGAREARAHQGLAQAPHRHRRRGARSRPSTSSSPSSSRCKR